MKRLMIGMSLLAAVLLVSACSDSNSDEAPPADQAHPAGWITAHDQEAQADPDGCAVCHGANLAGVGEAVSCFSCHTSGSPLVLSDCTSCHSAPPDSRQPAGNVRPNRAEGHVAHDALPAFPGRDDCSACHQGAGVGTPGHFDSEEPADVAIPETYHAKDATAAYDPEFMSCSGVSCHGGQESPSWFKGLAADQACTFCHESGTGPQEPEFNSYYSGGHDFHIETLGFTCTQCHAPEKLNRAETPNHFSGLATPEFEQDPATTLLDALNYDPTLQFPPSNPQFSTCTTNLAACHGGQERSW